MSSITDPIATAAQLAAQLATIQHVDQITLNYINLLHPKIRQEAHDIYINKIVPALTGRAICRFDLTLRTFAQQQALYNQGRTTLGSIVTNAKAGQSYHCYGLAIDYHLIIDGVKAVWDMSGDYDGDGVADWIEVEKIFVNSGWEWGGNWHSIKDYPHVQKTFGYHWSDLLALHNAGKVDSNGYVLI